MTIQCLPLGMIEANCYIVTDEETKECAVIDPGDESNTVLDYIERNGLTARYIFITHGHFDHTMAVNAVREETGAAVCMNKLDSDATISDAPFRFNPPEDTIWYKEGDVFRVGSLEFTVLETPGHTPGGVSLLCGDALFTGDTLFRDSCGRTDFPGGDIAVLMQSLKKLYDLPGNPDVYPGHMDATTLDRERRYNYYMRCACENG